MVSETAFKRMAVRLTLIYAAVFSAAIVAAAAMTNGLALGERGVVGGDFLAFYTAGDFVLQGHALDAYDFAAFDAALRARAEIANLGMMWQYPPAMFFLTASFAAIPYKPALLAWSIGGWGVFLASLRRLGLAGAACWLVGFSPFAVSVLDNGQVSLATAGLLFLSVYDPKKRWLLAGLAAGILTVKPQLGLLLPLAFLAIGAWRTIAVAAATAVILHGAAFAVFGAEAWPLFFNAVARLNADVAGAGIHTPPQGMTTLFGQLRMLGVSGAAAMAAQYALSAFVAGAVIYVWRRPGDALGKAALVSSGALLATPYAYSYEMAALALAGVYLVRMAPKLASPEIMIPAAASLWLMVSPALPRLPGLQAPFLITAVAFGFTLYRLLRPAPAEIPANLAARAA